MVVVVGLRQGGGAEVGRAGPRQRRRGGGGAEVGR